MGNLNFKQFLVILSLIFNLFFSLQSVSGNEVMTQDENNRHIHRKIEINEEPIRYKVGYRNEDSSSVLDIKNLPRHISQNVDKFNYNKNSGSDVSTSLLSPSSSSSSKNKWDRKSKPLKNLFLGIYKTYKSTYMGNKTSSEYRKSLQHERKADEIELAKNKMNSDTNKMNLDTKILQPSEVDNIMDDEIEILNDTKIKDSNNEMIVPTLETDYKIEETSTSKKPKSKRKKKKKKKKNKDSVVKKDNPSYYRYDNEYRYNFGPGVNISLDMQRELVSVKLDETSLKEILLGKWIDANEGRAKKYQMISKILPLFILPFLIQSAIVPFLVTKLKLLLIKSILVGKLAIFLLVISAIKNNQKVPTYEPAPAYWAPEPNRRSEIYNGYRFEGRPNTWLQ